jgi:ABC-type glycerol-3-phosphate transport system permease component
MASGTKEKTTPRLLKHAFLCVMVMFAFLPFYVMLVVAFKTNEQFDKDPYFLTPTEWQCEHETPCTLTPCDKGRRVSGLHWENWGVGWNTVKHGIANSVFLAMTGTMVTLSIALLAAYAFGRYKFPGSGFLWKAILLLLFMPGVANLIPLFNLMKSLHLLNSLLGLTVIGAAGGQIFALFMLRNFIEDMPQEFFECARIDGASHLQQVIHVVIPQCGGIISTLAILTFVRNWNVFILPLIVIRDPERMPLAVRLFFLQGAYEKQWGPLMAAYFISAVPLILLFAFTMRLFIRGAGEGAIKG